MGNCSAVALQEIKESHLIPVHTRDNSALISQSSLIDLTYDIVKELGFSDISLPAVRVSHAIKGRTPEARHKAKGDLLPHEQTLYYERMIFLYKINSIKRMINGNELSLIVGGIKAYNLDNFNKDYKGMQHFKIFIGFQVKACSNLCVWSDGAIADIKVNNIDSLAFEIRNLVQNYQHDIILEQISKLGNYTLSENEFAQLLGRARLYQYLPKEDKLNLPVLDITDTQINNVAKHYYQDDHFAGVNGEIDMWSLYNLFTHASKTSYIDRFVDRNKNASELVLDLVDHLEGTKESFFLS